MTVKELEAAFTAAAENTMQKAEALGLDSAQGAGVTVGMNPFNLSNIVADAQYSASATYLLRLKGFIPTVTPAPWAESSPRASAFCMVFSAAAVNAASSSFTVMGNSPFGSLVPRLL